MRQTDEAERARPAVMVVSSLVVRGAVGGRVSGFLLERMGFPVWSMPTVVLPWHPGQGPSTRVGLPETALAGAFSDLGRSARLSELGAVLTGYFGDAGQIETAARFIAAAKARSPDLIFFCDPIIGDGDGLFQPPEIVAGIRDRLLPLADMATPNRHELMALVGETAHDNDHLVTLARRLGPREVVVTSAFAPRGEAGALVVTPDAAMLALHERFDEAPHGTGDVFAALYLGHSLDGAAPAVALERAAAGTLAGIAAAVRDGLDDLPIVVRQEEIVGARDGVTVVRV